MKYCPECGSIMIFEGEKCAICGYIKKIKNNIKSKAKNKAKSKTKNKAKKKNKSNNKRKYNPNIRYLGGKTRAYNQRRFLEFEVLGNNYSSYYF